MNTSPSPKKKHLPVALAAVLLMAASAAAAELPRYTVTNLDDWWGPDDPDGTRVDGVALNNNEEILANDFEYGNYGAGLQTWAGGTRTDAGAPPYPAGYEYSVGHLRAFTNSGTWAVDAYSGAADDHQIVILNLRNATSSTVPDIPGAVMDGSAPALSSGGNYLIARSDDFTRGWLLDMATQKWTEISGTGGDVRPDAVNNSGMAAGRMSDADGNTVPFVWTAGAGIQTITDHGTPIHGHAIAINERGLVTGTADGRSFVFDSASGELTWITPPSDQSAADINNAGQIIGNFWNPPFLGVPGDAAWIATAEDGFQPLENLIGQDLSNPEWRIYGATDINDDGWILASAYNYLEHKGYQVLLRPVPEPGASALLVALGGFSFLTRRQRRAGAKA